MAAKKWDYVSTVGGNGVHFKGLKATNMGVVLYFVYNSWFFGSHYLLAQYLLAPHPW